VSYAMEYSGDTAEPPPESGSLAPRVDAFLTHHTVRQIQPLRVTPDWQPRVVPAG